MSNSRILCRVITYNSATHSILLVRNQNQRWWCAPGGGWDNARESILECAKREVFEETGIQIKIVRFLYVQTLYIRKQNSVWLELFWLAQPAEGTEIPQGHIDHHGIVGEARWFTEKELQTITVYPNVLKNALWKVIDSVTQEENRYLGHFVV